MLFLLLLTFAHGLVVHTPDGVEHEVVRQGAVPGLGSALGIDDVLCGGKLVQEVESFEAEDELAAHEGLAE